MVELFSMNTMVPLYLRILRERKVRGDLMIESDTFKAGLHFDFVDLFSALIR